MVFYVWLSVGMVTSTDSIFYDIILLLLGIGNEMDELLICSCVWYMAYLEGLLLNFQKARQLNAATKVPPAAGGGSTGLRSLVAKLQVLVQKIQKGNF